VLERAWDLSIPLAKLDRRQVQWFVERRAQHTNPKKGERLTRSTIRAHLRALGRIFKLAIREGFLPADGNPVQRVSKPEEVKPTPYRRTREEVERILGAIRETGAHADADLVRLLFSTGLRRTELAHVRVEDVDFGARELRVEHGKRGKRTLPIPERMVPLLERLITLGEPSDDASGRRREWVGEGAKRYLLPGATEQHRAAYVSRIFKRWKVKLELPRLHAHAMRHAFITYLARLRFPAHVIATLSGHSLRSRVRAARVHRAARCRREARDGELVGADPRRTTRGSADARDGLRLRARVGRPDLVDREDRRALGAGVGGVESDVVRNVVLGTPAAFLVGAVHRVPVRRREIVLEALPHDFQALDRREFLLEARSRSRRAVRDILDDGIPAIAQVSEQCGVFPCVGRDVLEDARASLGRELVRAIRLPRATQAQDDRHLHRSRSSLEVVAAVAVHFADLLGDGEILLENIRHEQVQARSEQRLTSPCTGADGARNGLGRARNPRGALVVALRAGLGARGGAAPLYVRALPPEPLPPLASRGREIPGVRNRPGAEVGRGGRGWNPGSGFVRVCRGPGHARGRTCSRPP
jgi:integrase